MAESATENLTWRKVLSLRYFGGGGHRNSGRFQQKKARN